MLLLQFLAEEIPNVEEDADSIILRRAYRRGDLEKLLGVYRDSTQFGISPRTSLEIDRENILLNFELQEGGIAALLAYDEDGSIRAGLAAAKSVVQNWTEVIAELDKTIPRELESKLEIAVYVEKGNFQTYFGDKCTPECSYWFWLRTSSFCEFLRSNSKPVLQRLWVGKFPVLVLNDLFEEVSCTFCLFVSSQSGRLTPKVSSFALIRGVIEKILALSGTDYFVMTLTFSPRDAESKSFVEKNLKMAAMDSAKLDMPEGQLYDFKKSIPAEVDKSVASFANACGGMLFLGIGPDGSLSGLDMTKDADRIADSLKKIRPMLAYETIDVMIGNALVIVLIVKRASDDTVYVLSGGARPFRYHSSTQIYAYDSEVIIARRTLSCESAR